MAKQRYINTRFWDDGYIVTLDPIEKLLFIYFLTNPLTEMSGAYEIPLRRIAFDTGIDADMVLKIIRRFADEDKIIYRDGWILVCNFIKHQAINPKIQTGIEMSVSRCPDWIKDRLTIAYDSLSHLNSNSNLNSNLNSNSNSGSAAGDRREDDVDMSTELGYPLQDLLSAFPDLILTPAQCGQIESVVTIQDSAAWKATIEKYQLNYNPALKRYLPDKVGNLLGVFRDEKQKLEKQNGTNKPQSFQDRRAELARESYKRESELRQRVAARDRELSEQVVSDSGRQLPSFEPNAD